VHNLRSYFRIAQFKNIWWFDTSNQELIVIQIRFLNSYFFTNWCYSKKIRSLRNKYWAK